MLEDLQNIAFYGLEMVRAEQWEGLKTPVFFVKVTGQIQDQYLKWCKKPLISMKKRSLQM